MLTLLPALPGGPIKPWTPLGPWRKRRREQNHQTLPKKEASENDKLKIVSGMVRGYSSGVFTWGPGSPLSPLWPVLPGFPWNQQMDDHQKAPHIFHSAMTLRRKKQEKSETTLKKKKYTHGVQGVQWIPLDQEVLWGPSGSRHMFKSVSDPTSSSSNMPFKGELGRTLACDRMAAAWASWADTAGPFSPPLWPKRNCKVTTKGDFSRNKVNGFHVIKCNNCS